MIYGIDLGTTFSAIAHVNPLGDPVCIPLGENGVLTIPSAVLFVEGDKVYVGEDAIHNSWQPNSLLVEFAKREMGLPQGKRWKYGNWEYTPEEISALILKKIIHQVNSEQSLPPVRDVIISHPQYFWMPQKEATKIAADLAGLNLVATITEPNAAAVAYGVYRPEGSGAQTLLVFDLGGGTFDVTLMRIEGNGQLRMLGSDGDPRLGGMNWDAEIVKMAKEDFDRNSELDYDALATDEDRVSLRLDAERAKIMLSRPEKEQHAFFASADGHKRRVMITRQEFEKRCRPLVAQCLERCERLFRKVGFQWGMVDEVLLVGNSTRLPAVQEEVKRVWGKEPRLDKEPKLVVAKGAALWSHWVSNNLIDPRWGESDEPLVAGLKEIERPAVSGCTAHGLGVLVSRAEGLAVRRLIEPNTQTPTEREELFYADTAGATAINVALYEGESDAPAECFQIGVALLNDLPPLAADQAVKVKFMIDLAGRLEVRVTDAVSGQQTVKQIEHSTHRAATPRPGTEQPPIDFETRRRHLAALEIV